jgi:cytochrome c553
MKSAAFAALALVLSFGQAGAAGLPDAPPGATACSGCHPSARSVDTAVPRLIGRNAADLVAAMEGFKSGRLPSTVMGRMAKAYSDDEIRAIADWYAAQKE